MIVLNTSILLISKLLVSNIFAPLIFTFSHIDMSSMDMGDIGKKGRIFSKKYIQINLNF